MKEDRSVRSAAPMQTAKTGYIVISVLLCAAGIFLLFRPDVSTALIGTAVGITLVAFGIVRLVGYFSKDLYRLAFQYDLALGVLLAVLGIVILTRPENLLHFLCIATGIYVIADGLMKLQIAADSRRFGIRNWWAILAAAAAALVLGVMMLVRTSASVTLLMRLLGLVLLAEGILNLITVLMTVKIIKNQRPDIIAVEYTEGE